MSLHATPQSTSAADSPRLSVVIPAYNEAANLPLVLRRLPLGLHEVVLVDGNSLDATVEVSRAVRPDLKVVAQDRRGKGNALACGLAVVTGDIVITLDADGSADPQEIPRFVETLVQGADVAEGTRFAGGGGSSDVTALRAWGNRWLNRVANRLFGVRCTDLCYGYTALWTRHLPALGLHGRGWSRSGGAFGDGFEVFGILRARCAKAGLRIVEVPSFEHRRTWGESHLRAWRDGARVLSGLVLERWLTTPHDAGRSALRERRRR